jgi:benzoyl-CoA reductase/2-hydroxyglutaryl-CoA dehydratase subunit BcrC/BadD/HgdB
MRDSKSINRDRETQYRNMREAVNDYNANSFSQSHCLRASRKRALVNAYYIMEAYKSNSKVAYAGEQFPNEILYAFKLVSLNIESMAALTARSSCIEQFLILAEENNLLRDICSNIRSSYGIALANCYPSPDIIFVNNHPCDGLAKAAYMIGKLHDCSYILLDTPNYINDDSISYLVNQMKNVMNKIADVLNIEYDENEFQKVIKYSNEAKDYYSKIIKLCENCNMPSVSRELYEIFCSNPWGLKEAVDICKTLYEEALEISQKVKNNVKGKRVLWIGQLPNHTFELIEHMEKEVEIIYWGALMSSNELLLDPNEPLISIAQRSIMYMWNSFRLQENIADICARFEISGVVTINAWGCRNLQGLNQSIRQFSIDNDLKYLTLDADYMDKSNYAFSHVKNRIDAFLEIMH